jgi:signal transduction histidine kinase
MASGNILVVDASQDSLLKKIETLIGESYKIVGVSGCREAIKLMRERRFDLLITAIKSPKSAELFLAEMVRKNDPALGIILLGNRRGIDAASQRLKAGPQAFLSQPFTASELERAVDDALEQRRLLRDNKRLKALLPLLEISKTMMSEMELGKLFDVILDIIWSETEADGVSLMLLDEAERELEVKAVLGTSERLNHAKEKVGQGLAGWVAKSAKPLLLTDETPVDHPLRKEMNKMGVSSVLCLPLVVKCRVIGVLRSSKTGGSPFTRSDLELLSILCGQAAIAIENARLFSGVKTQQARVEQLLKQTLIAQEHERRRISLEIHDGAAQWMVGASYHIRAFNHTLAKGNLLQTRQELAEIRSVIEQSIKELRRVIFDLQPPALGQFGLVGALHQYLQNFEIDTGIACSFQIEGTPSTLSRVYEITLYRVTQEALANVRKHAQATRVNVILRFQPDDLRLEIRDNGKGFDIVKVLKGANSVERLGLSGMKDRAETLGGSLIIDSAPGAGTCVTLTLALQDAVPEELSPIAKMITS